MAKQSQPGELPQNSWLTPEQLHELDRRVAEDDAAPDDALSWEEVKEFVLTNLKNQSKK